MIPLLLMAAAAFQDTAALDRAVAAFTTQPIGAEGGARAVIDARLRLAQCPTVALSWRSDAHDAVVVTCAGPEWRIFVPVLRSVARLPAAAAPAAITAVTPPAAPVIRRGDPVLIEAGTDGFQITREGIAAADAAPGARVAIRVEGSTQAVQGVAIAAGRVALPGFAASPTGENH
ncbi:flagella basal body P-ring formation protein FlgA [Sphingomonas sp.]|uniref:flagella basal body P-ring formation protein FlgA n=1 Tax=Sphingomonas sp. TaxID=28214 RepID=UPI003CC6D516